MPEFLKVDIDENDAILIEVTPTSVPEEGLVEVGTGRFVRESEEAFENVLKIAKMCALKLAQGLEDIAKGTKSDAISLEFGISLGLDIGAAIAKATSEGNFKVTLTWKQGDSKTSDKS